MQFRCPICVRSRSFHPECFYGALSWVIHGAYETPGDYHLVRRLAPNCYLCGTRATDHAEHFVARARGGADTWDNLGGACSTCNIRKSDRFLALTADQKARWLQHQDAFRAAYYRATPELVATELLEQAKSETWEVLPPSLDEIAEAIEDELSMLTEVKYHVEIEQDSGHVVLTFGPDRIIRVACSFE